MHTSREARSRRNERREQDHEASGVGARHENDFYPVERSSNYLIHSATPGVSVVRAGVKAREPRDLRRFWAAQSFQSFEFNRFNRLSVDVDSSIMPGGGEKVSRCGSTNFGRQRPREATGSRGRRVRPARPRESRLLCVCRDCVIHTRDPHSARTVGAKAYASDGQPQHLRAAGLPPPSGGHSSA